MTDSPRGPSQMGSTETNIRRSIACYGLKKAHQESKAAARQKGEPASCEKRNI